jgi:hypothetical protein
VGTTLSNAKKKRFSENNNNNNNNNNIIIIIIILLINNNTWAYQDLQNNYLTVFNSAAATVHWKGHLCDMQESGSIWKNIMFFFLFFGVELIVKLGPI